MRWLTCVSITLFCLFSGYRALHPSLPRVGAPPTLYCNQTRDDLRILFRRSIERAETSIFVMIYNFTDKTLLRLLEKRAREGVEIVLLTGKREAKRLKKKIPSVEIVGRSCKGLMHQKVVVIDGHLVWIGSTNWTPTSLQLHSNLLIGMESPELAHELQMSCVSRADGLSPPPLAERRFWCGGQEVEVWQLPTDEGALDRLVELIASAEHRIGVGMFTWTHPRLTEAIIDAHKRGVRVEVALDAYAAKGSSRKTAERLKGAGVATRIGIGPELLHHKLLWIDEECLVTGSANWTKSAFTKNDDLFLVLPALTKRQSKKMKQIWRTVWSDAKERS